MSKFNSATSYLIFTYFLRLILRPSSTADGNRPFRFNAIIYLFFQLQYMTNQLTCSVNFNGYSHTNIVYENLAIFVSPVQIRGNFMCNFCSSPAANHVPSFMLFNLIFLSATFCYNCSMSSLLVSNELLGCYYFCNIFLFDWILMNYELQFLYCKQIKQMHKQQLILFLISVTIPTLLYLHSEDLNSKDYGQFQEWKAKFNKQYEPAEETYRNKLEVQQHNKRAALGLESYFMGQNKFSDLSEAEWSATYLARPSLIQGDNTKSQYVCYGPQPPEKDLPDAFDWAAKSSVTGIKDQGQCAGAGYAFATVQAIESARYISSGRLVQLSAQQVIDCTIGLGNKGCMSGQASIAFGYLYGAGVASEKNYPYKGFTYNCIYTLSMKETQILGCVKVLPQREISMKAAVHRQPVAVSINASKMKNYEKGIFEANNYVNPCKKDPNHWMLLVGYGRDDSHKKNYWKLKNSWGVGWGQQGYLYIVRKGDGQGECGVQDELYYPLS